MFPNFSGLSEEQLSHLEANKDRTQEILRECLCKFEALGLSDALIRYTFGEANDAMWAKIKIDKNIEEYEKTFGVEI